MRSGNVRGLRIRLFGGFRVFDNEGIDLTPTSQKAQALIALLATAPDGARSRQWIQSKLWSDRASKQASGSLRQSLTQIRTALGPQKDFLQSDRHRVWLNLQFVQIESPSGQEFLEGIDARDSEFEDWLRQERAGELDVPRQEASLYSVAATPAQVRARPWTIAIVPTSRGGETVEWFLRLFSDATGLHIREFFSARVIHGEPERLDANTWRVSLEAIDCDSDTMGLRISLEKPLAQSQIWSANRHIKLKGGPPIESPDCLRALNELVEAIGDALVQGETSALDEDDPDWLCRMAIRGLFSMRKDGVAEADRMLARAFEVQPRGLYLAWRAQIKAIQRVERHGEDTRGYIEAGDAFCERALELEPNNSMVLATVANTSGHLLGNKLRSLSLAKRSVLLNPSNPMAWWSLASANVYSGDAKSSYMNATMARRLAFLSPHRFWWDNQLFGAALVLGRIDEAHGLAESAYSQNPIFRPSLRYLIAFYANAGRDEEALLAAKALSELEPDFSIERLVKDREYPASLLHRAPGLDLDKVGALA